MTPDRDPQLDAFSVDVRGLLDRNVANLYSHLVTRPTGRAVRMAIQEQLRELGSPALSLVDLSSVSVLDYSCADEVVAKLLLARRLPQQDGGIGRHVFFVFQGIGDHHREPIQEVLLRHELAAVARGGGATRFELMGARSSEEAEAWRRVEEEGRIAAGRLPEAFAGPEGSRIVGRLAERGLVFQHPLSGDLLALSSLVRDV